MLGWFRRWLSPPPASFGEPPALPAPTDSEVRSAWQRTLAKGKLLYTDEELKKIDDDVRHAATQRALDRFIEQYLNPWIDE